MRTTYLAITSGVMIVACSACSGSPGTPNGGPDKALSRRADPVAPAPAGLQASSQQPLRVAHVQTLPRATCNVHPTGKDSPIGAAIADEDGVARFYEPPSSWGTKLTLECTSPIDLSIGTFTADLELPDTMADTPIVHRLRVIPALDGDPDSYSQHDLIAAGYPPRPASGSRLYAKWLRIVSSPLSIDGGRPIGRFDQFFGNNNNTVNWGGEGYLANSAPFAASYGDFVVPYAVLPQGSVASEAAIWAGVGGWVGADTSVIQAGCSFNAIAFSPTASYAAWIEYFPQSPIYITFDGYSVSPYDDIYVTSWVSDASGNISLTGGWASYAVIDNTLGVMVQERQQQPNGARFYGASAEFIIERVAGEDLTEYVGGNTKMIDAEAQDGAGTFHDFNTDPVTTWNLVDTSNLQLETNRTNGAFEVDWNWVRRN